MESTTLKKSINWWDWSGVFFSGLCLIHCIATPLLLASASLWIASEWVHVVFFAILIPITVVASRRAYQSLQKRWVVYFLSAGVVVLGIGIFLGQVWGESVEVVLTLIGSVLLIAGHLGNRHNHVHRGGS